MMQWALGTLLALSCVHLALSAGKAAQIAVTVMTMDTDVAFNTTYIFGIYGRSSLTKPVSGQLVHVRSEGNRNHGCSDYNHDLPTHDWVALIERGECLFTNKVRVATKQYNASAVIVYDNSRSEQLVSMQSVVQDEVYLFVTQAYGRRLAMMVDSNLHVQVNITASDATSSSLSPLPSAFIVISIQALCCCLLHRLWL